MGHPRSGMVKKKKKAVPWQKRKKKKTRTNNGSINIVVLPAVGVLIIMSGQVLLVPIVHSSALHRTLVLLTNFTIV